MSFPRLCAFLGIVKVVDFLWLPLKESAKKVSSASTTPFYSTEFCMFCNASKTLCRQMKAVSLLIPQISAERRTEKLFIIHSMNLDQVSNDFCECSVIVLVRTVKDLLQSLQINL